MTGRLDPPGCVVEVTDTQVTFRKLQQVPRGAYCSHTRMKTCCHPVDCGHYSCPCGIFWDDGWEGIG